ncbi:MAG: RraA family protein [Gammaproteobacteria bacterium]|nr:RraA family protein [Gammaproteobacteria bacterium]
MADKPKSAEMHPGPGFRIRRNIERPTQEIIQKFREFETPDVSDLMNRLYTMCADIRNMVNSSPLVGPACTVKVYPGDNMMVHKALDIAQPGDIVVVDTGGSYTNAVLGDLVANKAKHREIAGFVIDGLVRDIPGLMEVGIPVYARGATPIGPLHRGPGELNHSISCGGIVVNPGDIITADSNGVVVVRKDFSEELLERLYQQKASLEDYIADVKAGNFSNAWVDNYLKNVGCLED